MLFRCVLPKGTPWKKERQEAGDGLLLFPVSGFTENLPLAAFLRAEAKNS